MSNAPRRPSPTTELLHSDRARGTPFGAIHEPVQASVQYGFDRVEDLIGVFQGAPPESGNPPGPVQPPTRP